MAETHDDDRILKQGFTEKKIPTDLDAIIIGSGMSGMTVAASLARNGYKVLCLEQHDVVGGNCHTFLAGPTASGSGKSSQFEFDVGLHYIGGKVGDKDSATRKQFDYMSGGSVEWAKMDENYDTAVVGDERFKIHGDIKRLIKELKEQFPDPADQKAIDKHFQLVRMVNKYWMPTFFVGKFLPNFISKPMKAFVNMWYTKGYQYKTTLEVLQEITPNKKLQGVLMYHFGDYGEVPERGAFLLHALLWSHYIGGAYYPIGGPSAIAKGCVKLVESLGGKFLVRANVDQFIMDPSGKNKVIGVEVSKGSKVTQVYAPMVISTIGAPKTYMQLLPPSHQDVVSKHIEFIQRPGVRSEMSLMSMFVGIEGDDLDLPRGNFWVFPTWDHCKNWELVKEDQTKHNIAFMSFSSEKDPTYKDRFPGKHVALVIAPGIYEPVEEFADKRVKKRGDEYENIKEQWKQNLLSIFLKEFPHLKEKITYLDMSTAVTNDYYLGTHRGAIYGLGHGPQRFEDNGYLNVKTPFSGLYLSGQDVLSCGIVGALNAGFLTGAQISSKIRKDVIKLMK